MKIYVFDLDDTIACSEHRVQKYNLKNSDYDLVNWNEFFEDCLDDTPIQSTIDLMRSLSKDSENYLVILSARGLTNSIEKKTKVWLEKFDVPYERLILRDYDLVPPKVIKTAKWKLNEIQKIEKELKSDIVGVFDDRNENVLELREAGYTVFQIQNNDY